MMRLRSCPEPSGKESPLRRQDDGLIEGFQQAPLVGLPGSSNIEGRAVVHGGANHGKPDGHVHAGLNPKNLDRTMTLIVVHGDYQIEVATLSSKEQGISRKRTFNIDAAGLKRLHGGLDLLLFLTVSE
jgi:hypothetical protein